MPEFNSTTATEICETPCGDPVAPDIGAEFGRWKIVGGPEGVGKEKRRHWFCRCDCGTEKWVAERYLSGGRSYGCRSCRHRDRCSPDSLIDKTFGDWIAISIFGSDASRNNFLVVCRCLKCSGVQNVKASLLRNDRLPICRICNKAAEPSRVRSHHWDKIVWAANQRGLSISVTASEVFGLLESQGYRCALTGLPIGLAENIRDHMKGGTTASLDRIDSAAGYHLSNLQWVHKEVNKMKWELSQDRFIELCKLVTLKHASC